MSRFAPLLAVVALLAGCSGDEPVEGDLLVTAQRVFDGRELIEDGVVVIRGDEIVAVGSRDDVDAEAPRRIELGDATLLPGLIDLHVHGLGDGQRYSEVTTVRDVGSGEGALPLPVPERGAPRVLAAGPLLTVPGGYPIPVFGPGLAGVVRGPEDARRLVRRLAGNGAALIKVALQYGFPVLSRAELRAIVEEAHERGLTVTAHVGDAASTLFALENGVDELAHMPCGPFDEALARDLVEGGVEIVGTLRVIRTVAGCAEVVANARTFVRAGGTLLYGSDFGVEGAPPGADTVELRMMVEAGLTPQQALTNATARAGEQLGIEGLGTLAEGASADVVGVAGDLFADLSRLATPELIVVRGAVIVEDGQIRAG